MAATPQPSATRELSAAPGTLGLSLRAALGLVPGASRLPFVAGAGDAVPAVGLALQGASFSAERLAAYSHLCGYSLSDTLPPTAPHLLAFGLQLALITDGAFPFPAIGLVHVHNRITLTRAIGAREPLDLTVHATAAQPHPRGVTFTLVTVASSDGEQVWVQHSTMLHRGPSNAGANGTHASADGAGAEPVESARWKLSEDLGRRYAGISGDRNPIHLHALSAKLFGFPCAIAHGMWTKARCLAALAPTLPDSYSVEVSFRKPILLPGRVSFWQAASATRTDFAVRAISDPGRIHLEGTVSR